MAFELRDGQGSLFKNERKQGQQPDYRGQVNVEGKLWDLAGWIRPGKDGKPSWLSLKAQEPRPRTDTPAGDDEIPF